MNHEQTVLDASRRRLLPLVAHVGTLPADAYSMSPAIRLRYRILAEKTSVRPPLAILPPPVGEPREARPTDAALAARAFADGHPLSKLMRLRAEAAAEVERLLTFLDDSDGIADAEEGGDEDGDLAGSPSDLEDDRSDDEPSLGWCEGMAQGQGRWGDAQDLEMAAVPIRPPRNVR